MIYPISLYNLGKVCQDSVMVGNILRALCKQDVQLTPAEQTMLAMIQNDNTWMDERLAARKKANTEKVAAWREKKRHAADADVTECNGYSGDVMVTEGYTHDVTSTTFLPSSLPTSLPSNKKLINRTDTDPNREAAAAARAASGSDRLIKIDVYNLRDEDFFNGTYPTSALFANACGDGCWGKAIKQLGEDVCLQELNTFVHEVRAGECPRNPGATMTARLKRLGMK